MTTEKSPCEEVRIAAMASQDGESASLTSQQIDDHLRECETCRVEVERLRAEQLIPSSVARAKSSASLWSDIESHLPQGETLVPDAARQHEGTAINEDRAFELLRLIDELPVEQREVVRLRHLEHWSIARISESLHKPASTVVENLVAAAQSLHAHMSGELKIGDQRLRLDPSVAAATSQVSAVASDSLVKYFERVDQGEYVDPSSVMDPDGQFDTYFEIADQLEQASRTLGKTLDQGPSDFARGDTGRQQETHPDLGYAPRMIGRRFGDYELLELIAKGGMGVVYKARQESLNRIVAVKMILSGQFADRQEVDRFYTEAEAAANLRHPNIVSIYEVGAADNEHFFSMDYVDGKSLADIVRRDPLSPQRGAETVKTIAEAMQYAHERGILHRDLKPANILIDESGKPMITDFGLAKRIEEKAGMTVTGAVVGTPSYMPPEQAEARAEDVGPVSDVYSLGAILYELLTGRPPFRAANPFETVRKVIEEDPQLPRTIDASVPRDLETICMKCLQKEPEKRYQSANELAAELDRYLKGEPILARPITSAERVWRWCRRNPKVAGSLSAAAAGVLVALVAVSTALVQVAAAKAESDQSYRMARSAVDEWFTQVSEYELLNQPAFQPLRNDLLKRALDYYQDFLRQREGDPTIRDEIAVTHFRIGLIQEAIGPMDEALAAFNRAHDMQQALLAETPKDRNRRYALSNTLTAMGNVLTRMERFDEALDEYEKSLVIRQQLVDEAPSDVEYQRKLANAKMNIGIAKQKKQVYDEALQQMQGGQKIRLAALKRAKDKDNDRLQTDLGKGYYNLATLALENHDQAQIVGDEKKADQQIKTAVEQLNKAIEAFEKVLDKNPKDFATQIQLATCYKVLADVKHFTGLENEEDRVAAIQYYDQAQPIIETLARMNPDVADFHSTLAALYTNLGLMYAYDGNGEKSLETYRLAQGIYANLAKDYPNVPAYRRELGMTYRLIGSLQAVMFGQFNEAEANMKTALDIFESLVGQHPDNPDFSQQRNETKAGIELVDEMKANAAAKESSGGTGTQME